MALTAAEIVNELNEMEDRKLLEVLALWAFTEFGKKEPPYMYDEVELMKMMDVGKFIARLEDIAYEIKQIVEAEDID